MPSRTSIDSSAPIMAPSNVRPRSQFNLYPSTTSCQASSTTPNFPPSYTTTPASPPMHSPPRNFSRPQQQAKPIADILSQSTTPSNTAPPSNRTSIFGTQVPAPQPLGRSNTITSTASRQTLSSELSQREIKRIEDGLDKLENKKLGQQRYVPSAMKETDMQALKLGAKLERALDRRLGGQDAVMRPRGQTIDAEKGALAA